MEKEGNEIEVLEKNQLIVGNGDSILLFGCEAQQQLREFSKAISNQLLNSNGDLEYLIHDLLKEIDDFQISIEKKAGIFSDSNEKKRERLIKKYNDVLVYMDKMELALKLQEAQLIKDSKLFEELSRCIDETLSSLQTTYVCLNMKGALLFKSASATLTDEAQKVLTEVSKILKLYQDNLVEIEGHTDNVPMLNDPIFTNNNVLSAYRAMAVFDYVVNDCGVSPAKLKCAGRGEYAPIASNDTADGRAQNRRVEIKIYNSYSSY